MSRPTAPQTTAADAIIVGGGLMGCATALFLARRGWKVVLLERDLVGRQASGANFGAVRRQGRDMGQLPLANRSIALWRTLPEIIGEDCEFVGRGHVRVALDAAAADRLAAYADEARHHGLDLEILGRDTAKRRFPYLSDRVVAASFSRLDGHANPRLAGPAFARAARRAGGSIHENASVTAIEKTGADFLVETARGQTVRAPVLAIMTGAWSAAFAAQFGEAAPLEVKGPQMSVTEPVPYVIGPNVSVAASRPLDGIYFRQVTRGNIVIGGPVHGPASIETGLAHVLPQNTVLQLTHACALLPMLDQVSVIRTWSGVEGYTIDSQPVMGESRTTPGLFYAFGFSGAGFQLGPAVGEVMASRIAAGRAPIDLTLFRPGRFPEGADADGAALKAVMAKGR